MTAHAPRPVHDTIGRLDPLLARAIARYERALADDDTATLGALFADNPDELPVVRSDGSGMLVGHAAITAFRARRGGAPARTLHRRIARQLDADNACVVSEFDRVAGGRVIQTQVWTRLPEVGWRIVAAHLTYPAPAVDGRIWRVVGTPLVAARRPGPLSGMTVAVKDLYAVAGQRIGAGNPDFLAEAPVETRNAPAVARLLDTGADVLGIARTDEFAYSLAGMNVHYGTPPNPRAPGCISGGSSSGPASAVACGQATIGLGTDTAGSIRIPASYQGLWGIRTTHGRLSCDGIHPLSSSFDTVGWMTRDAMTLGIVAHAMMPSHDTSGPIRGLLVCPDLDGCAEADVRRAFGAFRSRAVAAAGTVPALTGGVRTAEGLTPKTLDGLLDVFQTVRGYEAWQADGEWVEGHWESLAPEIADRFRGDRRIDAATYRSARGRLDRARSEVRAMIGDHALLLPTASSVAPPLTGGDPTLAERARARTLRLTCLAGVGGLPAVTIPLETDGGLPCGACLVGPAGSDRTLIELAKDLVRGSEGR